MNIPQGLTIRTVGKKGKGLFVTKHFKSGTVLFTFDGIILPGEEASALSLQIDMKHFLESVSTFDDNLNHSCDPNGKVEKRKDEFVYVLQKDVSAGDELTFDYDTTEFDMVEQKCSFECHCGSVNCKKNIRGFKYLSHSQQKSILPFVISYLKKYFLALSINS